MKICFLTTTPYTSKGGAELFLYELSQELAKRGHEVTVLSRKFGNEEPLFKKNIKIQPLFKHTKLRFLLNLPVIYKYLKGNRFDLIHAHFILPSGLLAIFGKLFNQKTPVLATAYGMDIQKNKEFNYGLRLNKFYDLLARLVVKQIDFLALCAKTMLKDAKELGCPEKKMTVIYNGLDPKKLKKGSPALLKKFNILPDDYILLYLGRFITKKRPQDLVVALPAILKKIHKAKLFMVGKGEEENALRRLVTQLNLRNHVIFTGPLYGKENASLFERADVFVLPSVLEGHPLALVEAMFRKKTIVTTNIESFSEIFEDEKGAILIPLRSPRNLAESIIELYFDKKKRKELGEEAFRIAREKFSIKKATSAYLRLYHKLLSAV